MRLFTFEKSGGRKRKAYLILSICSTCLVLFIFKYFNFFNANFSAIAHFLGLKYPLRLINIILPIGLSFHTFQSLSYVIEVYRGNQKTERNFGIYSLYVMFYPQLVAGPIERPQNLLHQFRERHYFDIQRISSGLQLMTWGFFKKLVIADRLSHFVNIVYDNPTHFFGYHVLISTIFFAFQIYCDFSGYSDIARACARIMGFDLMVNFRRPYFAKSISEFWKRWHISLSTWFRDYLYIPLGGNRVARSRWYFNLFLTFLISGFWHGANWTYIAWGSIHGIYLVSSSLFKSIIDSINKYLGFSKFKSLHNLLQVLLVFVLVNIGWVFFRSNNIYDVGILLSNLTDFNHSVLSLGMFGKSEIAEFILSIVFVFFLLTVELIQEYNFLRNVEPYRIGVIKFSFSIMLLNMILYFGIFNKEAFIYFQF